MADDKLKTGLEEQQVPESPGPAEPGGSPTPEQPAPEHPGPEAPQEENTPAAPSGKVIDPKITLNDSSVNNGDVLEIQPVLVAGV